MFALHEEWAKHPEKYACLKSELDTPFTQANEREQSWQRYLAWLQKQVEEPMLLEAFGLKQVYVPLRAYYKQKVAGEKSEEFERPLIEDEKYQRVVLELEIELEAWLEKGDCNDAIRVISGGPGSGKSSFAKIFAANQAEKGKIPVLFIPLHHFEPSDDLVDAVGKFVRDDGFLRHNPLDKDQADSRLLIIFDGLDELAMQGKIATEIAQQFVREVQRKVERFNGRETCLQVLISGRELVVQANPHPAADRRRLHRGHNVGAEVPPDLGRRHLPEVVAEEKAVTRLRRRGPRRPGPAAPRAAGRPRPASPPRPGVRCRGRSGES